MSWLKEQGLKYQLIFWYTARLHYLVISSCLPQFSRRHIKAKYIEILVLCTCTQYFMVN